MDRMNSMMLLTYSKIVLCSPTRFPPEPFLYPVAAIHSQIETNYVQGSLQISHIHLKHFRRFYIRNYLIGHATILPSTIGSKIIVPIVSAVLNTATRLARATISTNRLYDPLVESFIHPRYC